VRSNGHLRDCRSKAAQKIIFEKVPFSPLGFNRHAEHPKRKQIKEQMPKITMKKQIRHWLPNPTLSDDLARNQAEHSMKIGHEKYRDKSNDIEDDQ
jgi:hypothetical protein